MAIQFQPPLILPCGDGDRCIIVPDGERAVFEGNRLIEWSAGCRFTVRGYAEDDRPLWPGAVPEKIHPWPLPSKEQP